MPDQTNYTPIQAVWMEFTSKVRILLIPQSDDRPLDQYLPFRETVIALVQSPKFLEDLNSAWTSSDFAISEDIKKALIMELDAFRLSAEVAQTIPKSTAETPAAESKGWRETLFNLLGRASTTVGSLKDIVELSPYAKAAVTLFKELIDLFKGKKD
jgi:hypothetical protein